MVPDEGERNTAPSPEREDNHSRARDFKRGWEGGAMQTGVTTCTGEAHCQGEDLLHVCCPARCLCTARHKESVAGDRAAQYPLSGVGESLCRSTGGKIGKPFLCKGVMISVSWGSF